MTDEHLAELSIGNHEYVVLAAFKYCCLTFHRSPAAKASTSSRLCTCTIENLWIRGIWRPEPGRGERTHGHPEPLRMTKLRLQLRRSVLQNILVGWWLLETRAAHNVHLTAPRPQCFALVIPRRCTPRPRSETPIAGLNFAGNQRPRLPMKSGPPRVRHGPHVVSQHWCNVEYPRLNRISRSQDISTAERFNVCSTSSRFNRYS